MFNGCRDKLVKNISIYVTQENLWALSDAYKDMIWTWKSEMKATSEDRCKFVYANNAEIVP